MYCPKCAAQNSDDGRFCRVCGTDISFVVQALTGKVSQSSTLRYDSKGQLIPATATESKQLTLYKGIRNTFLGIGFILVALSIYFFAPAGRIWWFWLLIPAFGNLGNGLAEILRSRHEQRLLGEPTNLPAMPPAPQSHQSPPSLNPGMRPPSVTEGTTRTLKVPSDSEN